ncbi:hypothetical protein HYQ46_005724 [Verticillium longisporum]|nr:hypothetical protein HYQ46_005724 [Verticillium longisporum]
MIHGYILASSGLSVGALAQMMARSHSRIVMTKKASAAVAPTRSGRQSSLTLSISLTTPAATTKMPRFSTMDRTTFCLEGMSRPEMHGRMRRRSQTSVTAWNVAEAMSRFWKPKQAMGRPKKWPGDGWHCSTLMSSMGTPYSRTKRMVHQTSRLSLAREAKTRR